METANTEVTVRLPETTAEKALRLGSAPVAKLNNEVVGWLAADLRFGFDKVPAALNADIDREPLEGMRDLIRESMKPPRDITDEEAADYPALADNSENLTQWVSARRVTLESPSRSSVAWVLATLAILGLLTAMLIVGIAISV